MKIFILVAMLFPFISMAAVNAKQRIELRRHEAYHECVQRAMTERAGIHVRLEACEWAIPERPGATARR